MIDYYFLDLKTYIFAFKAKNASCNMPLRKTDLQESISLENKDFEGSDEILAHEPATFQTFFFKYTKATASIHVAESRASNPGKLGLSEPVPSIPS